MASQQSTPDYKQNKDDSSQSDKETISRKTSEVPEPRSESQGNAKTTSRKEASQKSTARRSATRSTTKEKSTAPVAKKKAAEKEVPISKVIEENASFNKDEKSNGKQNTESTRQNRPSDESDNRASRKSIANSTPIQTDSPSMEDALNRKPFARYLSHRLGRLWSESNQTNKSTCGKSFVTHLYSEWGSGKTTFLNLLREEMQKNHGEVEKPWLVIDFNAWQNQHISPSWWALMESIYLGITRPQNGLPRHKRWILSIREHLWRYVTARYSISLPVFLAMLAGTLAFQYEGFNFGAISASATAVAAFLGIAIKTLGSLVPGNQKSARLFQELTPDPMSKIKQHFNEIVDQVEQPIMVFIDDLDRCREPFVVSLLESLHTLFNNKKVFYLVAADKKWVSGCFYNSYKSIAEHIETADRPTGDLFTEKLFQISIGLPSISNSTRRQYVNRLLGIDLKEPSISEQDKQTISQAKNYSDLADVDTSASAETIEAAMMKTLDETFDQDIEHRLQKYIDHLDPNPRFIKLLINAFGINVAVGMSSGLKLTETEFEHIAVWTIVSLRHPAAAQELEENSQRAKDLINNKPMSDAPVLSSLSNHEKFIELLSGKFNHAGLIQSSVIRALTGQEVIE